MEKKQAGPTSRQESLEDTIGTDKSKHSVPFLSDIQENTSTGRQPTRFSTRIVKRPRRDLSPPESPLKKGFALFNNS